MAAPVLHSPACRRAARVHRPQHSPHRRRAVGLPSSASSTTARRWRCSGACAPRARTARSPTRCCCSSTRPSTRAAGARTPGELPFGEDCYRAQGIDIVDVDRGGKLTYHGPGQLVGYPIMRIDDVIAYLRTIEQAIVATLAEAGLPARGRPEDGPDYTGVWTGERKIASIGVHVARGVTTHGFAINVDNDLQPFAWVVPCGLDGVSMTSVQRADRRRPRPRCRRSARPSPADLAEAFGRRATDIPLERSRPPCPSPSPSIRREASMSRVVDAVRLRATVARHRGDAVHCPVCDSRFDAFKNDWNRAERAVLALRLARAPPRAVAAARAPARAAARRALAAALLAGVVPVAAPARDRRAALRHRRPRSRGRRPAARRHRDRPARRRLRRRAVLARPRARPRRRAPRWPSCARVTAPGGFCLVMVPLALDREHTYEDASITAAAGPRARVPAARPRAPVRARHRRAASHARASTSRSSTCTPSSAPSRRRATGCCVGPRVRLPDPHCGHAA